MPVRAWSNPPDIGVAPASATAVFNNDRREISNGITVRTSSLVVVSVGVMAILSFSSIPKVD